MEFATIVLLIAFVEFIIILLLLRVCNESHKSTQRYQQTCTDYEEQVAILRNQLEVLKQPVKAENAYAAFRKSNNEEDDDVPSRRSDDNEDND